MSFFNLEVKSESFVLGLYLQLLLLVLFSIYTARCNRVKLSTYLAWNGYWLSSTSTTSILGLQALYADFINSQYSSAALTDPGVLVRAAALRVLQHQLYPLLVSKVIFGGSSLLKARWALSIISAVYSTLVLASTFSWLTVRMPASANFWGSTTSLFGQTELHAAQLMDISSTSGQDLPHNSICRTYDCVLTFEQRMLGLVSTVFPYLPVFIFAIFQHRRRRLREKLEDSDKRISTFGELVSSARAKTFFEQRCSGNNIPRIMTSQDLVNSQDYSRVGLDVVWVVGYIRRGALMVRRRDLIVLFAAQLYPNAFYLSFTVWDVTGGKVSHPLHAFIGELGPGLKQYLNHHELMRTLS